VVETLSYLSRVDLTPILPEIKTPTLILVGGQSLMNTDGRVRSLQQLLVNSAIKELEGASGYVQHSEPAMCAEAWLDFASEIVNN
jgi:pimeloyl-ACP methyl ester carboxylesterase